MPGFENCILLIQIVKYKFKKSLTLYIVLVGAKRKLSRAACFP